MGGFAVGALGETAVFTERSLIASAHKPISRLHNPLMRKTSPFAGAEVKTGLSFELGNHWFSCFP